MPKIAITELWLKHAHKRVDKPTEFTHDALDFEFGVVVNPPSKRYPKGTKTWFTRYQYAGSKRKHSLGRYPTIKLSEAAEQAKEVQRSAARGEDPRESRGQSSRELTFGELFGMYYEEKSTKKAYPKGDYYLVHKHLRDWIPRPVSEITRQVAREAFRAIRDGGAPSQCNQARFLTGAIFNWALDEELVTENPVHRLPLQAPVNRRSRYLSDDEIKSLLPVLRERSDWMADVLYLMLLTGQRKSEVLKLRWVDLVDGCWWHAPGKIELSDGRTIFVTKNRRPILVYLTPPALEILERRRTVPGQADWVFPEPSAPSLPNKGNLYTRFHTLRSRLGGAQDWKPHDLRRTVVTNLSRLGCPDKIKMAIVNHTYTHVHNRVYDMWEHAPEKMHWLTRWAEFLDAIESGEHLRLLPYAAPGMAMPSPTLAASENTAAP